MNDADQSVMITNTNLSKIHSIIVFISLDISTCYIELEPNFSFLGIQNSLNKQRDCHMQDQKRLFTTILIVNVTD
jgi:hypothetical protein